MTVRALAVLALAALIVALGALVYGGARWRGTAPTLEWPANAFSVSGGRALQRTGALVIQNGDANGVFIAVMPNAQLDARDYAAIEIDTQGLPERQPVAVLWRSRLGGGRTFTHQADIATASGMRVQLDRDPNWNGPITGVGVIVAGAPPAGSSIVAVRAVSASAMTTAREAVKAWFRVEGWNNQSINVVFLGGQYHPFPFTLFIGLATLLAVGGWWVWQRRRGYPTIIGGALMIAFAGWLALDLRWLANFGRVEAQTIETLAGKSWRDKELAAQDGPLFAFIEQARERIAKQPARVFFGSDDAWIRARGGYHLLPFNTLSIVQHRGLFEPARYRPGDWLCFYARSGVAYDPSTQTLRWDGGAPLKAERVLATGAAQLYRVIQ